jgi:hypothetical protein
VNTNAEINQIYNYAQTGIPTHDLRARATEDNKVLDGMDIETGQTFIVKSPHFTLA